VRGKGKEGEGMRSRRRGREERQRGRAIEKCEAYRAREVASPSTVARGVV